MPVSFWFEPTGYYTDQRNEADDRVCLIESDKKRGLAAALGLGVVRHVKLDVAKVRLEEHREPANACDRARLALDIRVRVCILGRVRMRMRMRVRRHCHVYHR